MRSQGKKTAVALLAFAAYGTAAVALAGELKRMNATVSDVIIQYLCGPTPVPGTNPHCPDMSTITMHFAGYGCTADDFVVKVRQAPEIQLATIFKRKAATECVLGTAGYAGAALSTLQLVTYNISPSKPVKFTNPVPVRLDPRP